MSDLVMPFPDSQHATALSRDEVHVWRASLDCLAGDFRRMGELLSPDEQARCRRYFRERDRIRFGTARGILRLLLFRYCGVPAAAIRFDYSNHGKPLLADAADLEFSVSHTDGIAVYALARGRRVGIDVELVREVEDRDQLVTRNFAQEEVAAYRALPAEARQRGFFNCWTRKEAFVKALGEGFHHDLTSFAVSLAPGEPARLLRTERGDPGAWSLHDLTEEDRFVVALAVEGTGLRVRSGEWPEPTSGQDKR